MQISHLGRNKNMKSIKEIRDNRKIAIYSRKSKFTGKGESTHNQIEA